METSKLNKHTLVSEPPKPPYPMEPDASPDDLGALDFAWPDHPEQSEALPLGGSMPNSQTTVSWRVHHLDILFGYRKH